ncbi:hypothetical protein [Salmonirosea aquatica]|uniref:Lipoprotein n=1 Tax=Salmonirosea aquatica TaxID=2654236 RepID=A0A7C9F4P5_9BACT|nr:hypothetical protein [Cytophagaceae bacterium SJW1-29]
MKKIFRLTSSFLAVGLAILMSCENPDLDPNVEFEGAASGFGTFLVNGVAQKDPFNPDFGSTLRGGPDALSIKPATFATTPAQAKLFWASFDNKVTVNKIELYVQFTEPYIDKDGNPAVANHGTKLLTTLDAVAAYEDNKFTVDASKVYDLFKSATFKYDGTTAVPVFSEARKRTAAAQFIAGDNLVVSWHLVADNGLVYKSWSPSVCNENLATNCSITVQVR